MMSCVPTTTLLVAEEDHATRRFVCENLLADGFEIIEADDADAARALLAKGPDAVICDLNGRTLELVEHVRAAAGGPARWNPEIPLLLLSSRTGVLDRIRAFDRGADDYLAKPFSYPELLARLRALLRRAQRSPSSQPVHIGPLHIDRLSRRVTLDGVRVELSTKEYGLLTHLAADPQRVLTKEELLRDVWGFRAAGRTRTLDSHACRLRRKLHAGGLAFVVNVWGVGYRLTD